MGNNVGGWRLEVGGWMLEVGGFLNSGVTYGKVSVLKQLLECWIIGMFFK